MVGWVELLNPPWWCQVTEKKLRSGVFDFNYQGFLSHFSVYMVVWLVKYLIWVHVLGRFSGLCFLVSAEPWWTNLSVWYPDIIAAEIDTLKSYWHRWLFSYTSPPTQKITWSHHKKRSRNTGPHVFYKAGGFETTGRWLSKHQDESWLVPGELGASRWTLVAEEWDILHKTKSKSPWKPWDSNHH